MMRLIVLVVFIFSLLTVDFLLPEKVLAEEFKNNKTDSIASGLKQLDSDSQTSVNYYFEGTIRVSEEDKLRFKVEEIKGASKNTANDSLFNHTYTISYFGDLIGKSGYVVNLFKREDMGGMITYLAGNTNTHLRLDIYDNRPSFDSYTHINADIKQSGYFVEGTYGLGRLRQIYTLYYDDGNYKFVENNKNSSQNLKTAGLSVTQSVLKFPNSLSFSLSQRNREVSRKNSSLFPDQRETTMQVTFIRQWNQNLRSETQIGIGNEALNNKDLTLWRVEVLYDQEPYQFVFDYQYQNESLTSLETNTSTTALSAKISF